MSDYNQRQYRLMLDRLTAFDSGLLQIDALVNDLEGLLHALEGVAPSWKQTFLEYWGDLEQARAMALFRGSDMIEEEAMEHVRDAVARLKLLVLEQIDDPADHPQVQDMD